MTAWWDKPHNPRTLTRCTATLTDDPRTRCTRWAHDPDPDDPTRDTWHRWYAVRWWRNDHDWVDYALTHDTSLGATWLRDTLARLAPAGAPA